ncbi:MAG: ribulose-phosphate 3-epimerase [Bacillota bacterium]|nr:ribulose-phosphate 3-epimerase [Bacillota bacterium]
MKHIAPSILSSDLSNIYRQVKAIEETGCKYLHIDVMDGHFVPNITFGPIYIKSLRKYSNMVFDVHLMIENPEKYIDDFSEAGADIITVHQETSPHLHRIIQQIKSNNKMAGVSINPATPIDTLKNIIDEIDLLLIMTVNPGFGGQKFIKTMEKKIVEASTLIKESSKNVFLEIDGGINKDNIKNLKKYDVDIYVSGSAVFKNDNIKDNYKYLMESING